MQDNPENVVSPVVAFQMMGTSPFSSDPVFMSRNVQLLPMERQPSVMKLSSLDLLDSLGDGFRNDEYFDTIVPMAQSDLKAAWKNIKVPDTSSQCMQIKFLIRRGVPDDLRQKVWKAVSGWTEVSKERPTLYAEALERTFGPKPPTFFRNYPLFGGLISPSDHYLISEADVLVKRLLVVIGLDFPRIDYCPEIPDLIQVLLAFMSEADVYGIIWCLLNKSKNRYRCLLLSKHEHDVFNSAFLPILARLVPRVHKHILSLEISPKDTRNFLTTWFSRMFVSSCPYQVVLRVFDATLHEGVKIWYRVACALLDFYQESLVQTTTSEQFHQVLAACTAACGPDADTLIKNAFAYQLSRTDMELVEPIAESPIEDSLPVFYRPKLAQSSAIIEDDKFEILWAWVPHRICIQDPVLVYSAEKHGWSLFTITHKCAKEGPILVLIKSDSGAVFGAFLTHPLNISQPEFYGDRDCFLWTLKPGTSCYRWTMDNDLFIKGENDHFLMGSGGSGYGLYIHKDMWGRSDPCATFGNPHLDPARPEKFQIMNLEIYGFR